MENNNFFKDSKLSFKKNFFFLLIRLYHTSKVIQIKTNNMDFNRSKLSTEKLQEIVQMEFAKIDANHDGLITIEEIYYYLDSMVPQNFIFQK